MVDMSKALPFTWWRAILWFFKALFVSKDMPRKKIRSAIIAYLGTHTYPVSTLDLHHDLFEDVPVDFETLQVNRSGRYVSLGKLYAVLGELEQDGFIQSHEFDRDPYEGMNPKYKKELRWSLVVRDASDDSEQTKHTT